MAKKTRPRKRPSAPLTSPRPRARPDIIDLTRTAEDGDQMLAKRPKRPAKAKKMSYGGKAKVKKMEDGGMSRGMGAATRGGNYKMG